MVIKVENKFIKGKSVTVTQGVELSRGGVFERNINTAMVDKTGKQNGKDIIQLKINKSMLDKDENETKEIFAIMQAGEVEIKVNGEIFRVKPLWNRIYPKTNKCEIYFEKV